MKLFFAEPAPVARLSDLGVDLPSNVESAVAGAEMPEGMPFFLEEDGSWMSEINAFFRDLPTMRCPSADTWRAYAMDIFGFETFLRIRFGTGKTIFEAGFEDFVSFKRARNVGINADRRSDGILGSQSTIDPKTWNRSLAAFDKLFNWALRRKLIERSPFHYGNGIDHILQSHKATALNSLSERVDDDGDEVKCITVDDYLYFRDVGLRGYLPGRTDLDRSFRGRSGHRNALFADLLVGTGMRVTEALSLFREELPLTTEMKGSQEVTLARRTTKNGRRRRIWVPNRSLRGCVQYFHKERQHAVNEAMLRGTYQDPIHLHGSLVGSNSFAIKGMHSGVGHLAFDNMSPTFRRRILLLGADGKVSGPALLWLNRRGTPLTDDSIRVIFAAACARCRDFGREIDCSPHTLRHTFAVHMLTILLRLSIGAIDGLRARNAQSVELQLRQITMNPLDRLRRLLGHRSMTTTLKYLTYVVEAKEYAEAAFDRWNEENTGARQVGGLALRSADEES